jgi:hypothetical protein
MTNKLMWRRPDGKGFKVEPARAFSEEELLDMAHELMSCEPAMRPEFFWKLWTNIWWQMHFERPWTGGRKHLWRWRLVRHRIDRGMAPKDAFAEIARTSQGVPYAGNAVTMKSSYYLVEKTLPPHRKQAMLAMQKKVAAVFPEGKTSR